MKSYENAFSEANSDRSCYLCKKSILQRQFTKLGFTIYRCPRCNFFSLNFNHNYRDFLLSYYREGYFTGDKNVRAYANYQEDKPNISNNARSLLEKLKHYHQGGNLLDVGCAMGFFMEEAQKFGFRSFGIEVSEYAGNFAKQKFNKRVFLGSVEEFFEKRESSSIFKDVLFDAVILSDLIEHLQDPRQVLKDIRKILKDNGIIVIQTGDVDSFWARLVGKNWHFFAPPQHLYFFSKKTLNSLLTQSGYKIIRTVKEGKYLSISYLLFMTRYMNIPKIGDFLRQLISNTPLNKISLKINLFDNMIIYAKKNN